MEIILLERVEKLGQMGDVVTVRPGYARNYLLPQRKALRATKNNIEHFESRRADLEARNLERRGEAEDAGGKLEGLSLTIIRQAGESGQLYGSVSNRDIAGELAGQGITIDRRQVELDQPVKLLGLHTANIRLHPEVAIPVTLNVARSAEEAEMQERLGAAVTPEALEAAAQAAEKLAQEADEAELTEEVAEEFFENPDEAVAEAQAVAAEETESEAANDDEDGADADAPAPGADEADSAEDGDEKAD